MFEWLGISAVNPALLWGALAVASPILIHLLSKRKFKIVDWAAMDFLMDADRRNRRRVRLENLLLLLLRCAVVILIAALVARPFLNPTGLAAQAMKSVSLERIILLDDSPSMSARSGKGTVFEDAKDGLVDFVREMAANRSSDTLTLLVTSRPDSPLVNGQYLGADKAEEIVRLLENLQPSDLSAQLDKSLLAVEEAIASPTGKVNRVVYIVTDLRKRDWAASPQSAADKSAADILRRISNKADGCFLVDVGNDEVENLLVADIAPLDKTLVAGVDARFEVTIVNAGETDADDVQIKLIPGDALEQTAHIDRIAAGQRASAPFTFTFRESGTVPVRAEIAAPDVLPADNVRHFAARVRDGVPVLVVDGDPSSEYGRSESFFVQRVLSPPGVTQSGNVVETVNENQFEDLAVDKYQVIYLCNIYRLSDDRVTTLENWVKGGGGLIVALGDKIDDQFYNQSLYRDGQGLLPARLEQIKGDETERQWVHPVIEAANHPVLTVFDGPQPIRKAVTIFRWWDAVVSQADVAAGRVSVAATVSDADSSPLLVEKSFGDGRVMLFTTPLDSDWSNWPAEVSFFYTLFDTNRYMARKVANEGNFIVGTPIRMDLDPSIYKRDARLLVPGGESVTLQAITPSEDSEQASKQSLIEHEDTSKSGIYTLELAQHRGETEQVVFAANLDPSEGQLQRIDPNELKQALGDAHVEIGRGRVSLSLGASGSRMEVWPSLLLALAGVLCLEQFLAWSFGRRRQ